MSKDSGMAAVDEATAVSKTQHDQAVAAAREEGRKAGLEEAKAASQAAIATARKEGATAERARLAGIEQAALPGHDKLVAECKADPDCTPGDAALRINAAERAKLGGQMKAIQGVENATGHVSAAPASERRDDVGAEKATTPEGWKAEYAASAKLQSEFPTEASYLAYKGAAAGGKFRIFSGGRAG